MKLLSFFKLTLASIIICSANQTSASQAHKPSNEVTDKALVDDCLSKFSTADHAQNKNDICRALAIKIAPKLTTKDQLELFIKNYLVAHPYAARHMGKSGYLNIRYELYITKEVFFDTLLYYIIEEIGKDETTRAARYHAIFESELIQACAFISYGIHCPSRFPATISRYFPQQKVTDEQQAGSIRHNAYLQWKEQTQRKNFFRAHPWIKYTMYALAGAAVVYGGYRLYKYL